MCSARITLDPERYRRKQARAWKAKTEAAKVRHELNLTQDDFAEFLGVSLATVRANPEKQFPWHNFWHHLTLSLPEAAAECWTAEK